MRSFPPSSFRAFERFLIAGGLFDIEVPWYGVEIVRLLQWYNSNSTLSCLADNALWGYCSRRPTHPKFDSGIGWSDSRVLGIKKFASMYIYGMFSLKLFFLAGKITNANRWFRTIFCARIWI